MKKSILVHKTVSGVYELARRLLSVDKDGNSFSFYLDFLRGKFIIVTMNPRIMRNIKTIVGEDNLTIEDSPMSFEEKADFEEDARRWYYRLSEQKKQYCKVIRNIIPADAPCATTNPED